METGFKKSLKNLLILGAVFLLAPFFYLYDFIKKFFRVKTEPKRILIIDNAKIGDLICATPAFRAIKEKFPKAHLAVLAIPRVEEILQNNSRIDELIIVSLNSSKNWREIFKLLGRIKKGNFDVSINLVPGTMNFILPFFAQIPKRITSLPSYSGLFYRALARLCTDRLGFKKDTLSVRHYLDLLKFIGISSDNFIKEVYFDDAAQTKAEMFLSKQGIKKMDTIVGMCLSAGNKIKEWGEENFARLADEIFKRFGFKIIMIGGPKDEEMLKKFAQLAASGVIISYRDFSLREVPALIKRFNYFISVDTGPLYIANALGVPVLDILGPCSMLDQPPVYEKCETVYINDLACWPCSTVIKPAIFCAKGHLDCLKKISVEMVLASFEKLIKKYPK